MLTEVTTYYLEITDRAALRPARKPKLPIEIRQARIPLPELNRFLYAAVGREWHWRVRLSWSRDQWLAYMGRPELETWVLYADGTPAGYYEQEWQPGTDAAAGGGETNRAQPDSAEIVNFGILPQFIGQGLGAWLLVHAVERGWQRGSERVWLHTCTLDHPSALAHYQARGLRLFDTKVHTKDVDVRPPSWPEA